MKRILIFGAILCAFACSHDKIAATDADDSASAAPIAARIVARGNEPGWLVSLGPVETEFTLDYGERRLSAPTPAPEITEAGAVYRYADAGLALTVKDEVCADDATGMPHPKSARLEEGERVMKGCAGEPASLLVGDEWVVEDIGGAGVIDMARTSILFDEGGKVSGGGACNRFGGTYQLTGEGLSFGPIAATKRACPPAVMDQEDRFFDALASVDRFAIDETGALILYGADKPLLLARR